MSKRARNHGTKKSKERREEPLGTMSYQTSSKRSPPFWLLIGARKLLDPLTKTAHNPKLDKKEKEKERFFNDACGIAQNLTLMYCVISTCILEKCLFTLRSKVELNWTRAIRHVIAQSVQFSKIAKKLNIDLCQFFSHRKEALSLLKS